MEIYLIELNFDLGAQGELPKQKPLGPPCITICLEQRVMHYNYHEGSRLISMKKARVCRLLLKSNSICNSFSM